MSKKSNKWKNGKPGFAAGMESLEKVWISFLRIPGLEIVWKLMKSFGKRWRVLENSFFEKDFSFFSSRRAIATLKPCPGALAKRCTFDLTVSCHDQLVHFRSRRGRDPLVHASFHVDRESLRLGSTRACNGHHTNRKDYKEGGRNAFDCVSLFLTWTKYFLCVSRIAAARLTRNGKVRVFNAVAF